MSATQSTTILARTGYRSTSSEAEFVDLLQRSKRPIADISYKDKSKQNSLVNSIRIGDLVISEIKTDGFISRTMVEPHLSFAIQVAGIGSVNERAMSSRWSASRQVYSVSYAFPMVNDFDNFHGVFIRPSFETLANHINNNEYSRPVDVNALRESHATVYAAQYGGVQYYNQINVLLSIVRAADGDQAFLERIGVESAFTTILVELLIAHAGSRADRPNPSQLPRSARAIDIICDHIQLNIGRPLTISQMEQMSGLTGRSLNFAFNHRFNCSPQEWQRGFLLAEARKRLLNNEMPISIKGISYELGFSSPSAFAAYYKTRFGELPTTTLARNPSQLQNANSKHTELTLNDV